ncbi:Methyltransferase-like protein 6 [Allomyces arbusculus]|nr:Methyltransferase-like protein 6 [Allomyces arbusculus]
MDQQLSTASASPQTEATAAQAPAAPSARPVEAQAPAAPSARPVEAQAGQVPTASRNPPAHILADRIATSLDDGLVAKAREVLAKDNKPVAPFWVNKYKQNAARNWDQFYKRNTTNFYKDRHWTEREFPELQFSDEKKVVFEVGCGVGNFIFPLIKSHPNMIAYACDFSATAVSFVQNHDLFDPSRCTAFVADLTKDDLTATVPAGTVDLLSAIFVLSAIPPEKMDHAVKNIAQVLAPGGKVLFRDYGRYDQAQLRFKPGHRLEDGLYVRQDGTMAFYFTVEMLSELFQRHGFDVEVCQYVIKKTVNRKKELEMDRVFVQGKFVKHAS